ncbi:MarR family winged helix-turn-helix transcriptional regulator [Vibrio rotiferianus]|nr:MarR family transcriptional regulator [Vibrio rotiferianus]
MNYIVKKYLLLFEKISATVQMSNTYDTDVDIYRSEIHIIQLIGDKSELYISEISRLIGITKGTISQVVKRLEKKGLVVKQTDVQNSTRQVVRLTSKGQTAYEAHNRFHKENHVAMNQFLETLDVDQRKVIEDFLTHAHNMIEDQN